jgi:hypothetical protein
VHNEHDETAVNLACIVVGIIRVSVRQKDKVVDRRGAEWYVTVVMCHYCGVSGSSPRYTDILQVIFGSHPGVARHSGLCGWASST